MLSQGMEVFSTVLWHLKEEVALSHLAQQVIAQDRHSPHAWAVLGNCFSLQKVCEQSALCVGCQGSTQQQQHHRVGGHFRSPYALLCSVEDRATRHTYGAWKGSMPENCRRGLQRGEV